MFGLQEIRYMNSVMGSGRRNALTKAQVRERYPHALKIIRAANNSWKIEHVDRVTFVHITTRVVTVFPDGSVVLNSGGWRTVTTKNRLNRFQSLGRVYSDKGRWYVRAWIDGGWINHPFVDGMKIKPGGIAIYPEPEPTVKTIRQADLTADCWLVQAWGLKACGTCEVEGTDECGGKAVLEKIAQGTFPEAGLPSNRRG